MKQVLQTKDGVDFEELKQMQGPIIIVLGFVLTFCQEKNLPCRVTNILGKYGVTETHLQGRAFDFGIIGWREDQIEELVDYVEEHAGHLGAYSASDMQQRVAVYGDESHKDHVHFQVKPM